MGTFEDKIKSKFDNASVEFSAEGWDAFDQKLDQGQMGDLLFSQKLANAFHFTAVPYSIQHWNAIQSSLNELQTENNFKNKFNNAVHSGPVLGWEQMNNKLQQAERTGFEKVSKLKLNEGSAIYQPQHWDAFLKIYLGKKRSKAIGIAAALVVGFSAVLFLNVQDNGVDDLIEKRASVLLNSQKEEVVASTSKGDGLVNSLGKASIEIEKNTVQNELGLNNINRSHSDDNANFSANSVGFNDEVDADNKTAFNSEKNTSHRTSLEEMNVNVENKDALDLEVETDYLQAVQIKNQEFIELNLSQPLLAHQSTEVELVDLLDNSLQIGMSNWLNFWDNPAITGVYGKHQGSFATDQAWKSFEQGRKLLGFEWNQPLVTIAGYEYQHKRTGLSVGTFVRSKKTTNWTCRELSISTAYDRSIGASNLRVGMSSNYFSNQLQTSNLTLREQVTAGSTVYTREQDLESKKVATEQHLTFNFGALWLNKYYTLAYSIYNPVLVRINHSSKIELNQSLIAAVHLPFKELRSSLLCEINKSDKVDYTPGLALSYRNNWYGSIKYENLERYTFNFGRQFRNGFRAYVTYGAVTDKVLESSLQDVVSQRGHIGAGVNYLIR